MGYPRAIKTRPGQETLLLLFPATTAVRRLGPSQALTAAATVQLVPTTMGMLGVQAGHRCRLTSD